MRQHEPKNDDQLDIDNDNCGKVDLSSGMICELPSQISELIQTLTEIDISHNQFIEFPMELTRFTNLKSIKLDFNMIRAIPGAISQIKNLEVLSLSHNVLQDLPLQLGQLQRLKQLNLGNNQLEKFDDTILSLTSLEILYVYNNAFVSFPTAFTRLVNLKEFGLEWFKYANPPISTVVYRNSADNMVEIVC